MLEISGGLWRLFDQASTRSDLAQKMDATGSDDELFQLIDHMRTKLVI